MTYYVSSGTLSLYTTSTPATFEVELFETVSDKWTFH